MTNFSKKYFSKPFLLLGFISLISLVYIVSKVKETDPNFQAPQGPTPTPADIRSNQRAFNLRHQYQINFTFNTFINHPDTLPVYESSVTSQNINDLGQTLVSYFKLNQTGNNSSLFQSEDKSKTLTINYSKQRLNYNFSPTQLPVERYALSAAESTVSKFVSSIKFFDNLKINKNLTEYLLLSPKDPHYETVDNSSNANYFNFSFTSFIDSYPYYDSAENSAPLQVLVGPKETIIKIAYYSQSNPNLGTSESKKTLTYETAISQLKSGQGEVIYLNVIDASYNTDTLPAITINSYQIEYRYNSIKRKVVPYYRFSGYFINSYNQQSPISLILPAVEL